MSSDLITALAALEQRWRANAAEDDAHGFTRDARAQEGCANDLHEVMEANHRMAGVRGEVSNVD